MRRQPPAHSLVHSASYRYFLDRFFCLNPAVSESASRCSPFDSCLLLHQTSLHARGTCRFHVHVPTESKLSGKPYVRDRQFLPVCVADMREASLVCWQYLAAFLATPRITDKEISALPLSCLGRPLFLEFQLRMAGSIASATVPR